MEDDMNELEDDYFIILVRSKKGKKKVKEFSWLGIE
jgi:hypothetical protein